MDAAAVSLAGLTKRFGSIVALDRLDLTVPDGSVFGIVGPNGAGKTTTLRILAGLARPTAGRAAVFGRDPVAATREGRVGYLPQEPRFYGWMRGRELLDLVGRLHRVNGAERRERVDAALDEAGLGDVAGRAIGTYSGGMRQRLGIAQALLHRPDLLILDEPVSSLDPEGRRHVLELVRGLRGRTTVLLSTHVLADVERVCDRAAVVDRGRLVTEGPLETLLAGPMRGAVRVEAAPGQAAALEALARRLSAEPWATNVEADPATEAVSVTIADGQERTRDVLEAALAAGLTIERFEHVRPSLEDVFLGLVSRPGPDELDGRGFRRPREVAR